MNDLISRQAAIDALGERPTVWTSCDEYAIGERNQYDCDRLAIETVPPAVVRCKDCKWWTKQEASLQGRCDAYGMYPTGEWYCARGERKDETTDR